MFGSGKKSKTFKMKLFLKFENSISFYSSLAHGDSISKYPWFQSGFINKARAKVNRQTDVQCALFDCL